ncbi:MAG TPA: hypothetical protein VJW23_12055 [Propionibacteriaceae bacterium]|nr:hypothetical protein [Propionibacteriaceae bacterium]
MSENTEEILSIQAANHEQLRRALLRLAEKGHMWRSNADWAVRSCGYGVRETIREAFKEVELSDDLAKH